MAVHSHLKQVNQGHDPLNIHAAHIVQLLT